MERVDLAVVGAGVSGTAIADAAKRARPGWKVVLVERLDRIGGRLHSVALPGVEHKIELGGMRFLTSHRRVARVVDALRLETHPFDRSDGSERSLLRSEFGRGPGDPDAGAAYDLAPHERGRSAVDLTTTAFRTIVPGAGDLTPDEYAERRASARYLDRRLADWPIEEALGTLLSTEGVRFVRDAFGYDSGMGPFNAGDAIEFLLGGGDPSAQARTPDEGMDAIPRGLAASFERNGGEMRMRSQLERVEVDGGVGRQRLVFEDGSVIDAARTVLTVPVPALRALAAKSSALRNPVIDRILGSLDPVPAMKLYLWYRRPWWRPALSGLRDTTDLANRKAFYLDTSADAPAALLAMYTDGRHIEPWLESAGGISDGQAAPPAMLARVQDTLRQLHPNLATIPEADGSALMHWGSDPWQLGWTFWRAGDVSDEIRRLAVQPDPNVRLHLGGEAFSRAQSWVEGALESAEAVLDRFGVA